MTRLVQLFLVLLSLFLPTLLLAATDNASQASHNGRGRDEQSRAPESGALRLKTVAELFGAGDSVSTYLALQTPAVHEGNPLISTSPAGLVGLAVTKVLMLELFDAKLSPAEKRVIFPVVSAIYASATFNNLLLAASATNPVAIIGGIAAGLFTHQTQSADAQYVNRSVYCSGENRLRDCTHEYSPQYAVHLP